MPVKKSSIKALSVAGRRAVENRRWKRRLSEAVKAATTEPSQQEVARQAQSVIDKAARHNIMHKNRAARLKSRLARLAAAKS